MIDQSHALIAHLDIEHLIATGEVKWSLLHVDLDAGREGIAAVQAAQAYHKRPKFRTQTGAPIAVPGEARSERAPVEQPTTGAGGPLAPAPVVNPDTEGEPCTPSTSSTAVGTTAQAVGSSSAPLTSTAATRWSTSSPTTTSDETDTETSGSTTRTKTFTPTGTAATSPTSPSPSSSTGASSARRDALLERWRALTPDQRAVYAGLTFDKTDLDAVEAAITTAATGEAFNYVAPVPERAPLEPMPEPDRPVDRATIDTLVDAIRASGHTDTINRWMAGHGWSVKARPTVANYERCRVALALAEATGGSDVEAACIIERGAA